MTTIFEQMLKRYERQPFYNKKNVLKEIIQEMVLCGLSRAGFFKDAAFYGGTALRIFYGLERFSEDLDFSLKTTIDSFDLSSYIPILQKEILSFGLNLEITEKVKTKESHIQSAFLKGNTKEHLLLFWGNEDIPAIHPGEVTKIKFEIDTNPPENAGFEQKYRLLPSPYEATLYDAPSLFAGKIHAVLCRSWKSRVKGRDLFDFIFFLSQSTPVNVKHLQARLIQSDFIDAHEVLSLGDVKRFLIQRFETIDYHQAKEDVMPFIRDSQSLDVWSPGFFKTITDQLVSA